VLVTLNYKLTREFLEIFGEPLESVTPAYLVDFTNTIGVPIAALGSDRLSQSISTYIRFISKYEDLTTPGYYMNNATPPELAEPFAKWLTDRDLAGLIPLFEIPISRFGYGRMSEIPALYAIKYMNTGNALSLAALALNPQGPLDPGVIGIPQNGFQTLFEKMATALEDVRLNVREMSIDRPTAEEYEKKPNMESTLEYLNGSGETVRVKCGSILTAFPQKSSDMEFMGLDEAEHEIFDKVFTQNYYSAAVRIDGPLPVLTQYNAFDNFTHSLQPPFPDWDGGILAFTKRTEDSDWCQLQLYALPESNLTDGEVYDNIKSGLAAWDTIEDDDIEYLRKWAYHPAVSPEDILNGFYGKLENLQGYRNTYHTGSLLNFETVESVMRYSKQLVSNYF
jgi:hypothetical protein